MLYSLPWCDGMTGRLFQNTVIVEQRNRWNRYIQKNLLRVHMCARTRRKS